MSAVSESPLYKGLCKSVRKQDHAELLRMLEMVPESAWFDRGTPELLDSFVWGDTPQGEDYWCKLWDRINNPEH